MYKSFPPSIKRIVGAAWQHHPKLVISKQMTSTRPMIAYRLFSVSKQAIRFAEALLQTLRKQLQVLVVKSKMTSLQSEAANISFRILPLLPQSVLTHFQPLIPRHRISDNAVVTATNTVVCQPNTKSSSNLLHEHLSPFQLLSRYRPSRKHGLRCHANKRSASIGVCATIRSQA